MTQFNGLDDLNPLWQRLNTLWLESEQLWNDPVRRDFEKKTMAPLQEETLATMREMARLMEVMAKAQRSVK